VTDGRTDRIAIANTRSQQYLPVQLSRIKIRCVFSLRMDQNTFGGRSSPLLAGGAYCGPQKGAVGTLRGGQYIGSSGSNSKSRQSSPVHPYIISFLIRSYSANFPGSWCYTVRAVGALHAVLRTALSFSTNERPETTTNNDDNDDIFQEALAACTAYSRPCSTERKLQPATGIL